MKCSNCGSGLPSHDGPEATRRFCDDACWRGWLATHPDEAKGWVSVSDLTPIQRAELDGLLGKGVLS